MRPNYHRGQVYPLFAFFLIALLGVSGLSVDIGYYRYQQRLQQTAADSAAISGALASVATSSAVTSAAKNDTSTNGFTDGSGKVKVTVTPEWTDKYTSSGTGGNLTSGSGTGVKVTITKTYGRFFGGFFFPTTQKITTSAVAILKATTTATPCLTGMGTAPSVTTSNGVKLVGPNCGIAINGDTTCNGGTINVDSFAINSAATNSCSGGGTKFTNASPAPSTPITDPCPFYKGCDYIQRNIDGNSPDNNCGTTAGKTITGSVTSSYSLGSFTCYLGATLNGVTLGPGVYVLKGGAQFTGTITGNGVVFYIDDDTTCACSKNNDVIDMSTKNATIKLTAPTSATTGGGSNYQGMLFYQNPSGLSGITPGCKGGSGTALNCVEITAQLTGSACPNGTSGIWYMPYASMLFNGQNNDCITGNLIFDDARFNGNGSQVSIFPPTGVGAGGTALQVANLVE